MNKYLSKTFYSAAISLIILIISCTSKEEVEEVIEGDYDTKIVEVFEDSAGIQHSDTFQTIITIEVKAKDRLYFSNPDRTFNYDHKDQKIFDTDASGRFVNDSVYLFVNEAFEKDYALFEGKKID